MGRGYGNYAHTEGAKKRLVPDDLMEELENSGNKFTKSDVLMITRNYDGKLMWLEKGNERAGLKHIELRHSKDFLPNQNILILLREVLQLKPILHEKRHEKNGDELSDVYLYEKDGFTYKVAYGSNGFIVTFYPFTQ
ncbi:hypothetical protein J2Z60_001103 [Lactobacillus colini]|uniref:Phage-Barnase-EndoU-ColicinE5/D-RelE like nuclease 3 domain-containing protein n=1 Tax=Lactobacillus colini TaxID=1819254 RepID=A0ABS4ME77_9LACO|nr:hypothetical protein [Lactobacillus colini]MBP2057928.1 hypothetical protein [Lactobacillus colini]